MPEKKKKKKGKGKTFSQLSYANGCFPGKGLPSCVHGSLVYVKTWPRLKPPSFDVREGSVPVNTHSHELVDPS